MVAISSRSFLLRERTHGVPHRAFQPFLDRGDVALELAFHPATEERPGQPPRSAGPDLHPEQEVAPFAAGLHPAHEAGADDLRPTDQPPEARALEAHALADGRGALGEIHPVPG